MINKGGRLRCERAFIGRYKLQYSSGWKLEGHSKESRPALVLVENDVRSIGLLLSN